MKHSGDIFLTQKIDQRSLLLLTGLVLTVCASQTLADTASLMTLHVNGDVEKRCSLGSNTGNQYALQFGQVTEIPLNIDCNTPFEYRISSANGGLSRAGTGAASDSDAFQSTVPYAIGVDIPLQEGSKARINSTCRSTDLAANQPGCATNDSGDSIAINQPGQLSVEPLSNPGDVRLSGSYSDTLVIEVQAR